ncbi:hypothetical protein RQP46_006656 [Phenoliferia psychrophenolica]
MPSEAFSAYGLSKTPPDSSSSSNSQFQSQQSQRQQMPPPSSSSSGGPNNSKPPSNGTYLARDGSQTKSGSTPGGNGTTAGGSSSTGTTASSSHKSSSSPQISPEQSRAIARTHFDALRSWLEKENALGNASSPRNNARDKLTRLTRQQFQELSTDVYDELVRRMEEQAGRPGEQPFLSVRGEFHPKRNQARQKLATLPIGRFRDLASDVYFELERRYPEFGEEEVNSLPPSTGLLSTLLTDTQQVPGDSPSRYSPPPVPSLSAANRSVAAASSSNNNNNGGPPSSQQNGSNKGGPSPVTRGGSGRVPTPTAPGAATNDVVVPNKSTMIVEEPSQSSGGGGGGGYDNDNARRTSGPNPSSSQYGGGQHSSNNSYGGGSGNGGKARPMTEGSDMDREQLSYEMDGSPQQQGGKGSVGGSANASRISQTSSIGTRFIGNYAGSEGGGRRSWEHEDREKVKSDYEYKITMLQSRMAEVQRENDDMRDALKNRTADTTRVRDLESQVRTHRDRYDDQTSTLSKLRTDFDALQNTRSRDGATSAGSRGDVERLTRERTDADELANELRGEVSNLVDEIRSVNSKYEELLELREKDQQDMRTLEDEVKTWRRKFEQAKTELRNVKATSQLFVGNIKMEADHMPASADGLIADVNVTSFQTCIDDLLSAARSKEPSSILPAMRAVVLSVEKIDGDVQAVDPRRLQAFPLADQDRLQTLKAKTNATLSNLMTASKNHATSFGLSPVSLVDAAASHLSMTVVDLVRLLRIRRTTGAGSGPLLSTRSQEGSREPTPPMPPIKGYGNNNTGGGSIASSSSDAPQSRQNLSTRDPTSETSSLRSPRPGPGSSNDYNNPTPRSAFGGGGQQQSDDRDREREREREREDDRYRQPSPSGYSQGGGTSSYGNYGQSPRVPPAAPPERASSAYDAEPAYHNNNNNNNATSEDNNDYRGSVLTYGSPTNNGVDRQEENWEQLKNYLETQTEAIVHSIQSLLTAIRSGAQGEQLNENLTQIITIVSSIVAISKDALPDESRAEGDDILRDLADNCDKLSGMSQSSATAVFDKQTKQAMASASFGVAKSLKALNALLDSQADSLTMASIVQQRLKLNADGSPTVVAVLANRDSLTYNAIMAGILRAGFVAFLISPRNAIAGVVNMLTVSKTVAIISSSDHLEAILLEGVLAELKDSVTVIEAPLFDDLFDLSIDITKPYSPLLPDMTTPVDNNATALIIHSSGSTNFPKPIPLSHLGSAPSFHGEYIQLTRNAAPYFKPHGENVFELCFPCTETHIPSVFNYKVDDPVERSYHTSDLVAMHPTRKGFFRIVGRTDDQLMLSTGEKTNPGPMESIIRGSPLVNGAIYFGRGRFQNGVLVEPAKGHDIDPSDAAQVARFRNAVWTYIAQANSIAPTHSRIFKEMILVCAPDRPLLLTPKGTVSRPRSLALYETEIEAIYAALEEASTGGVQPPKAWTAATVEVYVKAVVEEIMRPDGGDVDERDFFLQGCDSLQATVLRNRLLAGLRQTGKVTEPPPANWVYANSTLGLLSSSFLLAATTSSFALATADPAERVRLLESTAAKYSQNFGRHVGSKAIPDNVKVVLLTGATGTLGCYLLQALVDDPEVALVYAVNRPASKSGSVRQAEALLDRGLSPAILDAGRVVVVDADLSRSDFGIAPALFNEMRDSVTLIVHNAWRLDFNLGLASFTPNIEGVRNLVDFALSSPYKQPPMIASTSSVSVISAHPTGWVAESSANPLHTAPTGYGQSKFVAERILEAAPLRSSSIRIGQLSGSLRNGAWNISDWFPMLVKSAEAVGCLPSGNDDVCWLPTDSAAKCIVEFCRAADLPKVLHLVHPQPIKWSAIINQHFSRTLSVPSVAYDTWIRRLGGSEDPLTNPAIKLLPFYKAKPLSESGTPGREAIGIPRVQTHLAVKYSATLAALPQLGADDFNAWEAYWRKAGLLNS